MSKITLNEAQLKQLIYESIEEAMQDEGFFQNLGAAFRGAKQGYNAQQSLDADNSDRKRHWDREDLAANFDPWSKKPENTASMEANKLYSQFQEYRKIANQLLAKRNELIKKYGLIVDPETKLCTDPTKSSLFGDSGILAGSMRKNAQAMKEKPGRNTNPVGRR